MKLFDLHGRKAIVTGGTRGLGLGMAEALLEAGAEVVILGSSDKVHEVASGLSTSTSPCHGVVVDLASRQQRSEGFDAALAKLGGRLDILVNAAGVQRRHAALALPHHQHLGTPPGRHTSFLQQPLQVATSSPGKPQPFAALARAQPQRQRSLLRRCRQP